jgi:cysteinyl-tRNA synthetase
MTELQVFNSLTGRKEVFQPLQPGVVRMYVCGDTVYDFTHIGHARSKLAFDVVRRYLTYLGYKVTFVRNITDIDDKIIDRAAKNNESVQALTARFTQAMHEDYDRLNILRPDFEPKATDHMPSMVAMTGTLIDKGYAYVASDGDVMYSVTKFDDYGKLSGRQLADLRAGARVAVDEAKRDPLDFVLWKQAKPGEPSWDSPWGAGRPGWHIECSAMSFDLLGPRFDIHGGGLDLKFPHHENEIAQSCAATGDKFAKYWMHNGFVNVDNEKMAKSLGNFFRVREVLDSGHVRDPEVLRFFLISSHYRGPINYSMVQIDQADAVLTRLYTALRDVEPAKQFEPSEASAKFRAAMNDDFNTPDALAAMLSLATQINRAKSGGDSKLAAGLAGELRALGNVLGVLQSPPEEFLRKSKQVHGHIAATIEGVTAAIRGTSKPALTDAAVDALKDQRTAARKAKNFKESDRIRDELAAGGIVLEDKPAASEGLCIPFPAYSDQPPCHDGCNAKL